VNDILGALKVESDDSEIESASILYLFLVGKENYRSLFRQPEGPHLLDPIEYRERSRKIGIFRVVRLTTPGGGWKFVFSSRARSLHLDSVTENTGEYQTLAKILIADARVIVPNFPVSHGAENRNDH
jgi:hypothetical protein